MNAPYFKSTFKMYAVGNLMYPTFHPYTKILDVISLTDISIPVELYVAEYIERSFLTSGRSKIIAYEYEGKLYLVAFVHPVRIIMRELYFQYSLRVRHRRFATAVTPKVYACVIAIIVLLVIICNI